MSILEDEMFWEKVCNICNKIFQNTKHLNIHKGGHKETGDFECNLCQLVLKKKSYLKRHLEEIHQIGKTELESEEEDEPTDSDGSLSESSEDILDSSEESSVSDSDDSVSFPNSSKDSFMCEQCDIHFLLKRYLDDHLRYSHGTNKFECHECDRMFKYSYDLKRHVRSKHNDANDHDKYQPLGPILEKKLTCKICSKVFRRKDLLKKHEHTHNNLKKMHTCNQCEKTFSRKDNMKDHIRSVHNKERPFKCNACEKTFKKRFNLKRHKSVVHNI